ncbi:MAG: hypothetical protein WCD31_05470 [Gillisia sp.]
MKFFSIIFGVVFLLFAATCDHAKSSDTMEITGKLQPRGITSYQYGTHIINSKDKVYALKSKKVHLDEYEGETVTITGKKVDGYPLEGGPVLLEVLKLKE